MSAAFPFAFITIVPFFTGCSMMGLSMLPSSAGLPFTKPKYFFSIVLPSNNSLNNWCAAVFFAKRIKPLVCWSRRCTVKISPYFSCNMDLRETSLPNRSGMLNKPAGLFKTIMSSSSNKILNILKLIGRLSGEKFVHKF